MREIKVRAWHKKEKEWYYFVVISTKEAQEQHNCLNFFAFCSSPELHGQLEHWGLYTGLHDKNGREIYEGDILQGLYKVNYGMTTQRKLKCVTWKTTQQGVGFNVGVSKIWEIIGNVYEHPELLMKKPAA
jgi:hypothetical protein